jgi:hypothetical protein
MNIQIGGTPHIDGQIDNPEFYYQAMDIVNKFHADHNRAMREIEEEKELNKPKSNNVWAYIIAIIVWLVLISR